MPCTPNYIGVFVNVYFVITCYGGPEDGGWYYDKGEAVRSTEVMSNTLYGVGGEFSKEQAFCKQETDKLAEGWYEVRVETKPAEDYPNSNEVPRYHTADVLDTTATMAVEVMIKNDASVIWVNVDGICRLRVCRIPSLVVFDMRD